MRISISHSENFHLKMRISIFIDIFMLLCRLPVLVSGGVPGRGFFEGGGRTPRSRWALPVVSLTRTEGTIDPLKMGVACSFSLTLGSHEGPGSSGQQG